MDLLLYVLFGSINTVTIIIFGFSIIRFPSKGYIASMLGAAIVIELLSFMLREELDLQLLDILVHIVLLIVAYKALFKINMLYSIVISAAGYFLFVVLQMVMLYVLVFFDIISISVVSKNTGFQTYLLQAATSICCLCIIWIMKRWNLGFHVKEVPPHFFEEKIKGHNQRMLIAALLVAIALSFSFFLMLNDFEYLVIPVILIPATGLLLALRIKEND